MEQLRQALVDAARDAMPKPGAAALNTRQRERAKDAAEALVSARAATDPLIVAEHLRQARQAFDALVGRTSTEEVLDALFGRFCIGK